MWAFFASLAAGLLIGYSIPLSAGFVRWAGKGTTIGLVLLLLTMGAKIGMDPDIFGNLQRIGLQAGILAVAAVAGSIVALRILEAGPFKSLFHEGDPL
jgi:uncharacterized membrane protein YbjE (DUF340 family)